MPTEATEEFLAHYGVLGMRWGVNKEESTSFLNVTDPITGKKSKILYNDKKVQLSRNSDGSVKIEGTNKRAIAAVNRQLKTANAHPDHDIARDTLKKPLNSISNKDLKRTNERLQLEKQYSTLKYERSTVGKGQAHVKTTLALIGTGATVGITVSKLATPANIAKAKVGLAYAQRYLNNPTAFRRAMRVARLATGK